MVLITGSLAFDIIMDFPGRFSDHIDPTKIHILNLSFLVDSLKKQKGGTAGNIAYNLALLEIPVSILGSVGEDFDEYQTFLQKAGVDVSNIKVIKDEKTSQAFITTDKADNQITSFYPGSMKNNSSLKIVDLSEKPEFTVISPNDPKAMINFALECQKLEIPYMFDPGMQLPRLTNQDLITGIKGAKILIGNDYEIGLLSSKLKVKSEKLLENIKILITTLGEKGSIIQTKDQNIRIKAAKPKEVIDPTGAGDAYRAGFLAGYLQGLDLKVCGQMGSVTACYSVEKYGTTTHSFTMDEFQQKYKENYG
ncbi:TPA: carbohydrate kinase family protein [Candidatus Daviesbacteria bacterium]|nr:carbohydrate kinase family protein [Candidatus Daviesbacteria bacterium]